ncbi:MAG: dihydroorotate dehydrogenase electron transfer subunit [Calditrichaeota bacterium]|nr:dihydroorotate dehydrogenase electron transfer subunit [Calditrichota bacterium]
MNRPIAEIGIVRHAFEVSANLWDLTVEAPQIAPVTRAGQFVHVRVTDNHHPFLRRPLSVGPVAGKSLRLIFNIRGEGTRLLAAKRPGDALDLIGPLGTGFAQPNPARTSLLVGGGIGVVPLQLLDDQLPANAPRRFLLGMRSQSTSPLTLEEIEDRRIDVASDDGSLGFKGNVAALLEQVLGGTDTASLDIYTCGPGAMLSAVKRISLGAGIPAFASLEVPMGCGLGACQSCAVPRADGEGYYLVCHDGPVFDARSVILEPEVLP